ncbi:MAG: ThiF family adenylyltransferase, partial [Planctomycetaceae bacterium]|nr:ThiF family adenylyltransferase [Planctomycetaceae bacterium]
NLGIVNEAEQERLRNSRVAIVGMGGVGGVHLMTLARLGIQQFSISDLDTFELANFNRQYGARIDTLGRPKVEVMAAEVQRINPDVQLRVLPQGVTERSIAQFLDGVDLLIDGIDYFAIDMRRKLYRAAAQRGIPAVMAGPVGCSTAWLVFTRDGMPFDRYFDLHDGQSEMEQLAAFTVGLAPAALHFPYVDISRVNIAEQYGPSVGLACELCAGVAGAEALKLLLNRGGVRPVPHYAQFDAYRARFRRGRLWGGNRHPLQRLKRWWLLRTVASMTPSGCQEHCDCSSHC